MTIPDDIQRLIDLVGYPEKPHGIGTDWTGVERRLALSLPSDFKQLVAVFGTGPWGGFLHVLTPFAENELLLERAANRALGALHTIRRAHPEQVPFALFPEELGLFPWGITDNGDTLFWLTEGFHWSTVVFDARAAAWERHDLSSSALIRAFLLGVLPSRCLLEPFAGERPLGVHLQGG
ncbi:MAG: hypothetical protein HOW73_22395 [Polyangiaceae bacterium]|nr:hypothetical protein [Polyangiaceae bacterium]